MTAETRRAQPRDDIDVVGALAEPNRRALYEFVVAQRDWVTREQAAAAVALGRGVAAHHLDRLADEGLLDVEYRRVNDRRGPGAGRPAKVYRRAVSEVAVTLPARDYRLAARILADAVAESERDGTEVGVAVATVARRVGAEIASAPARRLAARSSTARRRGALLEELSMRGFEPELCADEVVVLHNCPFHQLAQSHTDLVCGMNLCLLDGVLDAIEGTGFHARLEPEAGSCCVRFHPAGQEGNT
ncbi:MAG TPA: transcriptional regulator [Acidimicrobiia bacterium]|nr:transcriptional regulator [Acidimicrobiia bacterium]